MSARVTAVHSRACRDLLHEWWNQPPTSVRYRLAIRLYSKPDIEIRDLLLTIFADDPADSEAVTAARQLWPLLLLTDPLHAPEDLRDEIDAVTAEVARVRMRVELLAAKFRGLEPWAEMWDRPATDTAAAEYARINIEDTARALDTLQRWLSHEFVGEQLTNARDYAAKIRVYDDTEAVGR